MFFNGWSGIGRTILAGALAYVVLVLFLRISGKRTLSKLNAFDLVVTVALGSTLATILLDKNVALAEGAAAFAVLILLQYIIAWFSVRSAAIRKIVKSEPALLLYRGEYLDRALRQERVTRDEILAAVRSNGTGSLEEVDAVVLETDGTLSVIKTVPGENSTLSSVLPSISLPP